MIWDFMGRRPLHLFYRSGSVKHEIAKLLAFYLTTWDLLYRDQMVLDRLVSAAHEIQKIIESSLD